LSLALTKQNWSIFWSRMGGSSSQAWQSGSSPFHRFSPFSTNFGALLRTQFTRGFPAGIKPAKQSTTHVAPSQKTPFAFLGVSSIGQVLYSTNLFFGWRPHPAAPVAEFFFPRARMEGLVSSSSLFIICKSSLQVARGCLTSADPSSTD